MDYAERSKLTIYIDVKSPYAFVALRPTLALEKELGLFFDWKPLTLDIPSYLGSARKNDSGKLIENNRSTITRREKIDPLSAMPRQFW